MKIAGFLRLMTAALFLSAQCVERKKQRADQLGELSDLFARMEGELRRCDLQMEELLTRLKSGRRQSDLFLSALLDSLSKLDSCSFAALWKRASDQTLEGLSGTVRKELDGLGNVLGRYDAATQCSALENCRLLMLREREQLLREQPGYRRLVFGLSLTVTGMIGILLI